MLNYRIAGLHVALEEVPGIPEMENFAPFAFTPGPGAVPDLTYEVRPYDPDTLPVPPLEEMELVSEDMVNSLYLCGDMMVKRIKMQQGDPRNMYFTQTIGRWDRATVYIPENWLDFIGFGNALSMEKTLLPFGALLLHCALIEYQGSGIAFTAPSQTGKSTQAERWHRHKGAVVVNGDRAILRVEDGKVFAYGSPYAGSSDLFIDVRLPLKTIVVLEQAKKNTIRPLSQSEGIGWFIEGTSLPFWQEQLTELGLSTLEKILTATPMYLLSCLPDEGAVECLHQCLI